MESRLKKHLDKLHAFDNERRAWLVLSAFVVISVLVVLGEWHNLEHTNLTYAVGAIGLVLSVTWWYWTMRIVRYLIASKTDEYLILSEVVQMVRDVKYDVKKLPLKD